VRSGATAARGREDGVVEAAAGAVAVDADQAVGLMAIESLDGVVEGLGGVGAVAVGERIGDVGPPAELLPAAQDGPLVGGGLAELLDEQAPKTPLANVVAVDGATVSTVRPGKSFHCGLLKRDGTSRRGSACVTRTPASGRATGH